MNKKTVLNYFYNLSYRVIALLVPLIITPYISRVLYADGIGRYAIGAAIVHYFVLFGMLGLIYYGNREIAYVRDDYDMTRRTFWELNILRFITMGVSIVVYLAYIVFFVSDELKPLYVALVFTLVASFFDISWLFTGIENFKVTAIRNALVKIAGTLLIFIFVKSYGDLWKYALILSGSTCIGQMIMWKGVIAKYPYIHPQKGRIFKHLRATIRLWIPTIAISVYTSLDKVMLGALVNETQVGYYENSQKLVTVITTVTTTLATVMVPRMSNYYKKGLIDEYRKSIYKCFSLVSYIAFPMAFGIMVVSDLFVPIFYGTGYEPVAMLLKISAFLVITLSWSSIFGTQVLISCGMETQYTIAVTSGALVNVLLNTLLIKSLGAVGAITASVIAEYIGMFIMSFAVIKRFKIKMVELFKSFPKYIVATLCMVFVIRVLQEILPNSISVLLVQVMVGVLIYAIIMIITREENTVVFLNIIHKKVKSANRGKNYEDD